MYLCFNKNFGKLFFMLQKIFILLFFNIFFSISLIGQCTISNFNIQTEACQNDSFDITNTSTNASSYEWDLCASDLNKTPTTSEINMIITSPSGVKGYIPTTRFFKEGDKWYAFLLMEYDNLLARVEYGNGIDKQITSFLSFNSLGLLSPTDIALVQQDGDWYGILTHWDNTKKISEVNLLKFGTSLLNVPVLQTTYGDFNGKVKEPWCVKTYNDEGYLYAIVSSRAGDSISVARWTDINNQPEVKSVYVGAGTKYEIDLVKTNCEWNGFISYYSPTNVYRLDFGASLWNSTPTITNLGNLGSTKGKTGIKVLNEGGNWLAFVSEFVSPGGLYRINIGANIKNNTPTYTKLNSTIQSVTLSYITENSKHYIHSKNYWKETEFIISFPDTCNQINPIRTSTDLTDISYSKPGNKTISLTAYNNSEYNTIAKNINILPSLQVEFSSSDTVCNNTIDFTITSIQTPDISTTYSWNFGDGGTSTLKNPSHTYIYPGEYDVTLTVSSTDYECSGSYTKKIKNRITNPDFTVQDGFVSPPLLFHDATPDPNNAITGWLWSFGDGTNTSNLKNPSYTYQTSGNFDVKLTTIVDGCSNDITKKVTYYPRPNFGYTISKNCKGDTTFFTNNTILQNVSDNIKYFKWDYGNGVFDVIPADSTTTYYIYNTRGDYNIRLVVETNLGLTDTLFDTIHIYNKMIPNFTAPTFCKDDQNQFLDASVTQGDPATAWNWDFNDGGSSQLKNPYHIFNDVLSYSVTLTVYTGNDCDTSITKSLTVKPSPVPDFDMSHTCTSKSILFTDNSTSPPNTSIIAYTWDFGDGNQSSAVSPSHVYSNAGPYILTHTVRNTDGCRGSKTETININHLPIVNFSPEISCENNYTQFKDLSSIVSGSINYWEWDFDTVNKTNDLVYAQNPSYKFENEGVFNVMLLVRSNNGCENFIVKDVNANAKFNADFDYLSGCDGNKISFVDLTEVPSYKSIYKWKWDFGDGFSTSILRNPEHTYNDTNQYTVTMVATSIDGCYDSIVKNVKNKNTFVSAYFEDPFQVCANEPYSFVDLSASNKSDIATWLWSFDEENFSTQQNPEYKFTSSGTYTVSLTVQTEEGCKDTYYKEISVNATPIINFRFTPEYGAPPLNVSFITDSTDIRFFNWDFGDDSDIDTTYNPYHTYINEGTYKIYYTAIDINGCSATKTKQIKVMPPIIDIAVEDVIGETVNGELQVSARIRNYGTRDITNLILSISVQGGSILKEILPATLYSGADTIYKITPKYDVSKIKTPSYVCIEAIIPNNEIDAYLENNSQCSSQVDELNIINPYPNPATGIIVLKYILPYESEIAIKLYDGIGKYIETLFSGIANEGLNILEYNTGKLAKGKYYYTVTFKDKIVSKDFVKQ